MTAPDLVTDAGSSSGSAELDVERVREHFDFPATGRVVTNNAASTQPPRELLALYRSLSPWYENVHRGQSSASQHMTEMSEESYDTIATWLKPDRPRSPLVAFTVAGVDPMRLAQALNQLGVESRAGCHCATLAHHDLGLSPPASCRLSFALYTSTEDVARATSALQQAIFLARR